MPPAGFKPTIPESKLPHTHALYRAATLIVTEYTHIKTLTSLSVILSNLIRLVASFSLIPRTFLNDAELFVCWN
jgi:hypothetical protein